MEYTTIHHIAPDAPDRIRDAIRYDGLLPSRQTIEDHYAPAETVTGTAEAGEAYYHGQGETVNRTQGGPRIGHARHMVHSTMAGDVLEMHDGEDVRFWLVDPIGFTELPIEQADNAGRMPHTEPLIA